MNSIILKNMPDYFYETLSKLFNKTTITEGYFPTTFKKAKVIQIVKPGKNPKLSSSYRPISILSLLDKVFEKIIEQRTLDFSNLNNIINPQQFGFRKDHSTVHKLKRVVNFLDKNKRNRKSTGVVFIDIEKAFDSIWHDGLVFKLNTFNYPTYLQKIIKSFLHRRSFVVSIDSKFSTVRHIPAGLPQGSVLSPTLYSIYTSDIPVRKEQEVAFCADDSALYAAVRYLTLLLRKWRIV